MNQNSVPSMGVPQEKVLQDLTVQINKHLGVISDAESRLWQVTHRLLNPRPAQVPPATPEKTLNPQTLEGQLKEIVFSLERKGTNLHEIATELERGI